MKKLLFILLVIIINNVSYSQVTVESNFIENSNTLNSQFIFPEDQDITQDLFFAIGPNGIPQYGQNVAWNLASETFAEAKFFHIKKGDWDRSAIRTHDEVINFTGSEVINPVSETPNVNMGDDWLKLGTSWNITRDNYAIAIVSFTNLGKEKIDKGIVRFSYPTSDFINITDIFIYNKWLKFISSYPEAGMTIYEFEYTSLMPREIRHLYIEVDIAKASISDIERIELNAEMVGYQSDAIDTGGTIPPHDPNALYLLNALENTFKSNNCSAYSEYPDLHDACEIKKPFWVNCWYDDDPKCPLVYSLNYPYCNTDSELLRYKITCLNDGAGYARHVGMLTKFDLNFAPFSGDVFEYEASHNVTGDYDYPKVHFEFKEIYLPGLDDEHTVYTYNECSADVTFTVKTLCNMKEKIDAQAKITFFDTDGVSVGDLLTNNVTIVPEQGIYTNYEPDCISCGNNNRHSGNRSVIQDVRVKWTNSELIVSFANDQEDAQISIQLMDISGRLIQERKIASKSSTQINERLNISNLTSGIYFVAIQSGAKDYVEKVIKY